MADLSRLIFSERVSEGLFQWEVPDGWQQGRGAFGGLVFGALCHAAKVSEGDAERVLRTFTAELPAPVLAGRAELRVRLLRKGSGVSTWAVELFQGAKLAARATCLLGKPRVKDRAWQPAAPPAPSPSSVEVLPIGPPMGPDFARHFEFRPTTGFPFSGETKAEAAGWLRPKTPLSEVTPSELLACVDAWWPTAFMVEPVARPMATVSFAGQVYLPSRVIRGDEFFLHRAVGLVAKDGYVLELRELWSEQGELLATNQQTFVYIR